MSGVADRIRARHFLPIFLSFVASTAANRAAELHVSVDGKNSNPGTPTAPVGSIQRAADLAQPGDTITVHAGVYRECINPPRGGQSDNRRIIYRAAPGENVAIKGSEIVKTWVKVQENVWKTTLPNSFFGSFNPYSELIHGDWFSPQGRQHHTGAVYLNGDWLTEAARLEDVLGRPGTEALWFGQVDQENTTIWAQFKAVNPNDQLVEINARQTVFYPKKTAIDYITVRGFTLEHAATPWAPPTAEQIGLIGVNWSKGWIIESNVVRYSTCSGIALGKYGDQWDNTSANSAEGYVKTIERALTNGWTKENIGHHLVRNNTISHCEQAGIVGSLGAVFSTVTGNTIHDIHVRKLFSGAEMAGIKFHAAVDVEISGNHIYRTCLGLWLDWMAQGTHVTRNVFHDNGQDLFVEVDHGPFLVDNNLLLSNASLMSRSQGGAYAHNLIAGAVSVNAFDDRMTPFLKPHSTELAGFHDNPCGDDRYYNNVFLQRADLTKYDNAQLPVWMDGNVFLHGAKPCKVEKEPLLKPDFDPEMKLSKKADSFYLAIRLDKAWAKERQRKLVTTELLGKATIPDLPYERPDGQPIRLSTDYFGRPRNQANPMPGPFEDLPSGSLTHINLQLK